MWGEQAKRVAAAPLSVVVTRSVVALVVYTFGLLVAAKRAG